MKSNLSEVETCIANPTLDSLRPTFGEIRDLCRFPKPRRDMFILAKTHPYWLQLLRSSPVLAFLVARCWHFDGLPEKGAASRINHYVRMKRSAICKTMGFPSDQRTVRLLGRMKISGDKLVQNLLLLRDLLKWEPSTLDILERAPTVTTSRLYELTTGDRWNLWPEIKGPSDLVWFLKMPAAKRYWLAYHFMRCSTISELAAAFLNRAKSLSELRNERRAVAYVLDLQRRERAISQAEEKLKSMLPAFSWPDPPIPASGMIIPVVSIAELEEEGRQMNHCVGTYVSKIFLGDYYVYRVMTLPRLTLGIEYSKGLWRIDQIKGPHNTEAPEDHTRKMVNAWLQSTPAQKRNLSTRRQYLEAVSKLSGLPLLERHK